MINITANLTQTNIDYSNIYNLIQDYPDKTFWLLAIGFIALVVYIYLPIVIRNTPVKDVLKQILLATSFMFYGFGVFMMIPIHFTMTPQRINLMNNIFNSIVIIGVIILGIQLFLYLKRREADKHGTLANTNNNNTINDTSGNSTQRDILESEDELK